METESQRECAHGVIFFFSSRRRHTRLQGDWSSDVCSSDLQLYGLPFKRSSVNVGPKWQAVQLAFPRKSCMPACASGESAFASPARKRSMGASRSEERRVGKEGRGGRWRGDGNRKSERMCTRGYLFFFKQKTAYEITR